MTAGSFPPRFQMDYHRTALNLARAGNWDEAHRIVQDHEDELACLIHAWLHRQEGDDGNAGYWYRRAGATFPANTLDEEWQRLYQLANPER